MPVPATERPGQRAGLRETQYLCNIGNRQFRLAQVLECQIGTDSIQHTAEAGALMGEVSLQASAGDMQHLGDDSNIASGDRQQGTDDGFGLGTQQFWPFVKC